MSRRKFLCLDCHVDTGKIGEFYMIQDDLWIRAVNPPTRKYTSEGKYFDMNTGMLCISCLEKRIGRQLTPNDFTACYLNDPTKGGKSLRLLQRICPSKSPQNCN